MIVFICECSIYKHIGYQVNILSVYVIYVPTVRCRRERFAARVTDAIMRGDESPVRDGSNARGSRADCGSSGNAVGISCTSDACGASAGRRLSGARLSFAHPAPDG